MRHFCANCDCDEEEHSKGPCALCGTCQEFAETAYVPPDPGPLPTTSLASAELPADALAALRNPDVPLGKPDALAARAIRNWLGVPGAEKFVYPDNVPPVSASAEAPPAPIHICDKRGCTGADAHNQTPAAAPLRPAREGAQECVAALRKAQRLASAFGPTSEALFDEIITKVVADFTLADRAARPEVAEVERLRGLLRQIRERLWDPTLVVQESLQRLIWDLRGIVANADRRGEP